MAKTEDAHQLVIDKRFPCVPAAPRKARRLDSAYRQVFAEARIDHQLLSPVVQHVIVRVSRSGINLQTTACRAQLLSQHLKRRLQWWRRSDDEPAGPRQFKTLYEEFGGNRRNEHFGPSVLCQPIQIADMLFVMMCGNNRADCIQG